ncbi:hypothetical protein GUITHDRAFT_103798 [Guillardia theta CCMP2712]|uniref:Uncharacterized protein n=1 Tax=Guillardia theta (strain CCMP2712) TaxID=905079 RepID=L1JPQ1_GUITC|nr:hypothetical protein GUITHDRAFT_103798 [Guillardia theta CCMP2712]EKX50571.1 hypothetical protein GUITHDRAFT_103798 [Guillardia theta CCMP2712]|eukprot:XP_005837551.1 hypothetical protein GUITHDRAFT_103798 [Guillardia theta CCMP2712]
MGMSKRVALLLVAASLSETSETSKRETKQLLLPCRQVDQLLLPCRLHRGGMMSREERLRVRCIGASLRGGVGEDASLPAGDSSEEFFESAARSQQATSRRVGKRSHDSSDVGEGNSEESEASVKEFDSNVSSYGEEFNLTVTSDPYASKLAPIKRKVMAQFETEKAEAKGRKAASLPKHALSALIDEFGHYKAEKLRGVIIDVEAVLFDTEPARACDAIKVLCQELNIDMEDDDYLRMSGRDFSQCLAMLCKGRAGGFERDCFFDLLEINMQQLQAIPFAETLIRHFKSRGIPIALVSSAPRALLDHACKRHAGFFSLVSHVICADEVPRSRPFPDAYLAAARKLNLPVSDCLSLVGTLVGLQASLQANLPTIGEQADP